MTPAQFENLDRLARLAVLAEVQHHSGVESLEYIKLARMHEYLQRRAANQIRKTDSGRASKTISISEGYGENRRPS